MRFWSGVLTLAVRSTKLDAEKRLALQQVVHLTLRLGALLHRPVVRLLREPGVLARGVDLGLCRSAHGDNPEPTERNWRKHTHASRREGGTEGNG